MLIFNVQKLQFINLTKLASKTNLVEEDISAHITLLYFPQELQKHPHGQECITTIQSPVTVIIK